MSEIICSACDSVNSAESNFCTNCQVHLKQARVIADLKLRITQLEQTLAQQVDAPQAATQPRPAKALTPASAAVAPEPISTATDTDWRAFAERWLGRIGILLVIFAAIFLFRYAIDQGWLTPERRVLAGLIGAACLCLVGWRLRTHRPALGRVILGGGIATFYVTGYAAFELYDLISLGIATAYFIGVTTITITLSAWQDEGSLALLAAIGGFLTPYMLSSGGGDALALAIYTSILVLGLSIVFWLKGWLLIQLLLTYGGWFYAFTAIDRIPYDYAAMHSYRLVPFATVIIMLLVGWIVPLVRQLRLERGTVSAPDLSLEIGRILVSDNIQRFLSHYSLLMVLLTPFLTTIATIMIFEKFMPQTDDVVGWIFIGFALIYLLVTQVLYRNIGDHASTAMHTLSAAILSVLAVAILIEQEEWIFIALAVTLACLMLASHWLAHALLQVGLHGFAAVLAIWITVRLVEYEPFLSVPQLTTLFAISVIACGIRFNRQPVIKTMYAICAHMFILGWLAQLFREQQGFVSIAWGVYAIILLIIGLVRNMPRVQLAALATIGLIVIKLFLVDLSDVEAIWRVLLFLGVGVSLLILSFFYRKLAANDG